MSAEITKTEITMSRDMALTLADALRNAASAVADADWNDDIILTLDNTTRALLVETMVENFAASVTVDDIDQF